MIDEGNEPANFALNFALWSAEIQEERDKKERPQWLKAKKAVEAGAAMWWRRYQAENPR
jgi:hypothetical protein